MFTKCIHLFTYSINKCSFAQSCDGYYYKQHSPEENAKAKSMPAFPRNVFLLKRNLCAPIQSAQSPRALYLAKPRAFCTPQDPLLDFGEHFPVETPPLSLKCIDSRSPPQMCGHTQLSGCRPFVDRQHEVCTSQPTSKQWKPVWWDVRAAQPLTEEGTCWLSSPPSTSPLQC